MNLVESRKLAFSSMDQGNFEHMNDLTSQLNKLRDIVQDKFWRMAYGDHYVKMDFSKVGKEVYAYFENLGCDLARHVLWVGTETHIVIQLSAGWRLRIPVEIAEKILVLGLP